jgi:hypothetical protein
VELCIDPTNLVVILKSEKMRKGYITRQSFLKQLEGTYVLN